MVIGIPAAVAAGHLMAAELYGVDGWNLMVLGTTAVVLGVVALIAAALPARRASCVEPMRALRND
jgi:ABC-type antimicrobial peptide transport system permease subunit